MYIFFFNNLQGQMKTVDIIDLKSWQNKGLKHG